MTTELLFRDDAYLRTATARVLAVHERGIELERTIFYPQGGGQPGDTGSLLRANGERIPIVNTFKGDAADSVLHVPLPAMPQRAIGETLTLEIDWERRYSLMRLHRIPGIDLQPCGGTHVRNIAEIGGVRVLKIRSEGKRNKRVEIALAV